MEEGPEDPVPVGGGAVSHSLRWDESEGPSRLRWLSTASS